MTLTHDAPEPGAAQSLPPVQFSDLPSEAAAAQEAVAVASEGDASSPSETSSTPPISKDVRGGKEARKAEKKAAKAVEKAQKAEQKAIKAAKKATRKAEKKAKRAVEKAARKANEKTAIVEARKASKAGEAHRPGAEEATGKLSFDGKMDRDEVAAYLEALAEGLRKGSIHFRQRNESLALSPAERTVVEVTAQRKAAREKLSLEVEWRTDEPEELTIVTG
jgi:amphi-Trp domain-containing protein